MRKVDLLRLSIHNLLLHKVRSFLTSLGIIFGVGSVITMLAISKGAEKQALDQIKSMGIDNILLYSKEPIKKETLENEKSGEHQIKRYGLTEFDFQKVKEMDNIQHLETLRNCRVKVLRGVTYLGVNMVSVSQNFHRAIDLNLLKGRWLSPVDFSAENLVCVLGKNARKKIFGLSDVNPIGKRIRINNHVFQVVGIVESKSDSKIPEIGSVNDLIFITQTLSKSLFDNRAISISGSRSSEIFIIDYDLFIIKVKNLDAINNTERRIVSYLQKTHKDKKDWDKIVPFDLLRQKAKTQNIFTIIMASIASISLVVGGVGIMNIMLANIYERRKEIGTSRALGAKQKDILYQFLCETIFLTTLGGVLGVALGVVLSEFITYYAKWSTVYSAWSILLSLLISSIVGIVFGTYPAIKAAKQNPIDVLRSE